MTGTIVYCDITLIAPPESALFSFAMNPVLTSEGMVAHVCVDYISGIIDSSNGVSITLDPTPGTADGENFV